MVKIDSFFNIQLLTVNRNVITIISNIVDVSRQREAIYIPRLLSRRRTARSTERTILANCRTYRQVLVELAVIVGDLSARATLRQPVCSTGRVVC